MESREAPRAHAIVSGEPADERGWMRRTEDTGISRFKKRP